MCLRQVYFCFRTTGCFGFCKIFFLRFLINALLMFIYFAFLALGCSHWVIIIFNFGMWICIQFLPKFQGRVCFWSFYDNCVIDTIKCYAQYGKKKREERLWKKGRKRVSGRPNITVTRCSCASYFLIPPHNLSSPNESPFQALETYVAFDSLLIF